MFGSIDITDQLDAFKKYFEAQRTFEILPNLRDVEGSPVYVLNSYFNAIVNRMASNEPLSSTLLFELLKLQALSELCHKRLSMNSIFGGAQFDFSADIRCCDFAMTFTETTLLNHEHFYFRDLSITATESVLQVPPSCHIYCSIAVQDILQAQYLWNSYFRNQIRRVGFIKAIVAHLSEIATCKNLLEAQGWLQH